MSEEIPTEVQDLTQREGKMLFDNSPKRMPTISSEIAQEESAISTQTFVELMREMNTPTKLKNSKTHQLLMADQALTNYPSTEYAEMIALFQKAASYFLVLGQPQISAMIIKNTQDKQWDLQGVQFGLRKMLTTTRAEVTRQDNKTDQQQKGGINLDPRAYIK
jgi:hypothetical protein